MPDTSRSRQLRQRARCWPDLAQAQKFDGLLQNVFQGEKAGIDDKVRVAAGMFQPLQFRATPGLVPTDIWTSRPLGRQICLQKNEPVRWSDTLPHVRHLAVLLGDGAGVKAQPPQSGYKCRFAGRTDAYDFDKVTLHLAAPIGGPKQLHRNPNG